jgi:hypothetical protein
MKRLSLRRLSGLAVRWLRISSFLVRTLPDILVYLILGVVLAGFSVGTWKAITTTEPFGDKVGIGKYPLCVDGTSDCTTTFVNLMTAS